MEKEPSNFANAFQRFQEWKDGNKENKPEGIDIIGDKPKKDATIDIEKLHVYIQDNHILKDVSLKLYDKKITCIIGPSGCGKTTLLKSINRMIDTTEHIRVEGSVLVDGENIYDRRRRLPIFERKSDYYPNVLHHCRCLFMIILLLDVAYMELVIRKCWMVLWKNTCVLRDYGRK